MIKEDLIELKNTRMFLQESAEVLKKARDEFDKQNSTLLTQRAKAKIEESALIDSIKKEALEIYNVNGHEKSIGYGVNIQDKKQIIFDENDALQWAITHHFALKLDTVAFKKIALIRNISCVRINIITMATIPGKIDIGDDEQ